MQEQKYLKMLPRAFNNHVRGFTLIEVLVTAGIMAILLAIMLPSLAVARTRSRIVGVHSDLRQITLALDTYMLEQKDRLPPTRQTCGTNVLYQLPVELAIKRYLPKSSNSIQRSFMEDPFNPGQTYRYRAPGAVWQNGILMDFPDSTWRPRSQIWVPDDFPNCKSDSGKYYANRTKEPKCPVIYTVWSVGPEPDSSKFPRWSDNTIDESLFPLPSKFWMTSIEKPSGLITHYKARTGVMYMSP